jgi:hypothetical protein
MQYELTETVFDCKSKYLESGRSSLAYMRENGFTEEQKKIVTIKYHKWEQYMCNLAFMFTFSFNKIFDSDTLSLAIKENIRVVETYNDMVYRIGTKYSNIWIEIHKHLWHYFLNSINAMEGKTLIEAYAGISDSLIAVMKSTVFEVENLGKVIYKDEISIFQEDPILDVKFKEIFGISLTDSRNKSLKKMLTLEGGYSEQEAITSS